MKHLRKSLLAFLALTLFGGAGAWAQGPTAAEINSDLYSGWTSDDGTLFKASELPGFQAITEDQAKSWAGVPSTGYVILFYEFVADGHVKYVRFENGVYEESYEDDELERYFIYEDIEYDGSTKYFYTTGGGAIELTKVGDNQWTLGQTPDYDLELQVEYYEAHALKNIPAGWTVLVNGVPQTQPYQGDSLLITETDSVTLIPANPRRVKSVTLADDGPAVQTITVAGLQLIGQDGDSWGTIKANNPDKIELASGQVYRLSDEAILMDGECGGGSTNPVSSSTTYNASWADGYHWCE